MQVVKYRQRRPWQTMFDEFFNDETLRPQFGSHILKPATNIIENEDAYILELAVPGFNKEDFNINVDGDALTISTEIEKESDQKEVTYSRKEFKKASFKRMFSLPETVNTEAIRANYESGILSITLAKKEEAKPLPPKNIVIE